MVYSQTVEGVVKKYMHLKAVKPLSLIITIICYDRLCHILTEVGD